MVCFGSSLIALAELKQRQSQRASVPNPRAKTYLSVGLLPFQGKLVGAYHLTGKFQDWAGMRKGVWLTVNHRKFRQARFNLCLTLL